VNESAITGESAPVIRESGDRSAVTGGTRVLSDWLVIRVTANPGETFLDRMIAMVEGAKRQKTPNEIALNILLAALTVIFLLATATLLPFSLYSVAVGRSGNSCHGDGLSRAVGVSDPDDDRRIALCHRHCGDGIAWCRPMSLAMSGRLGFFESGRATWMCCCSTKTGTITLGNVRATAFLPADGVSDQALGRCGPAFVSLADETPRGA